jgi:hypothetical protein
MDLLRKLSPAPDSARGAVSQALRQVGRAGRHTFPFGNPVSIERSHVAVIKQLPYWVAEKTDGVRVAIICTRTPGTTQAVSYIMDRMGQLYGLPLLCSQRVFDGSLFDAELVHEPDTDTYAVQVFDVAALHGDACIGKASFTARRAVLQTLFHASDADWTADRSSALLTGRILSGRRDLHFVAKPAFQLTNCDALQTAVSELRHATDGYILTPDGEGASEPGTAWTTYKVKTCHTIDLLWSANTLWYGEGDTLYPILDLRIHDDADVLITFDKTEFKTDAGCIVEVSPSIRADGATLHLTFVKARPDRDTPNNVVCVCRTLKSALDNICLDDVIA